MNFRHALLPIVAGILLLGASSNTLTSGVVVDAKADIFAAKTGNVLQTGGKPPSVVPIPSQARLAIFSSVTGRVSCCSGGTTFNGPDGGTNYSSTDITSSGGISGVIHKSRTMFLVGVFVGSSSSAAPRLDVTNSASQTSLSPMLNQTFYVGSGKSPHGLRVVHIPAGAARLYLGFADASAFHGTPGAYSDNLGSLRVNVQTK